MFLMCFLHGFRVSELCNLTLSDIDLESRILYVRRFKRWAFQQHNLLLMRNMKPYATG